MFFWLDKSGDKAEVILAVYRESRHSDIPIV